MARVSFQYPSAYHELVDQSRISDHQTTMGGGCKHVCAPSTCLVFVAYTQAHRAGQI